VVSLWADPENDFFNLLIQVLMRRSLCHFGVALSVD
jgi:hypothetical protein